MSKVGECVLDVSAPVSFVAFLLEFLETHRNSIQGLDGFGVFGRISEEHLGGFGVHELGGELSGGNLQASLGDLLSVMFAEIIGHVILDLSETDLVFLLGAPFFVTAAGTPVGDIALGNANAALFQGPDYPGIFSVVLEELVNEIAFELGETSDLAVAQMGGGSAMAGRRGEGV